MAHRSSSVAQGSQSDHPKNECYSTPNGASRLQSIRLDPAPPMPPAHLLDASPLAVQTVSGGEVDRWLFGAKGVPASAELYKCKVAVDLDDTLLFGSHTIPELWSLAGGYNDSKIANGLIYKQMKRDVRGLYNALRNRPSYDQHCRNTHPFLANPRIVLCPNVPLISVLERLKKHGASLSLITASARPRVAFLLNRLPVLRGLFGESVYTAEDIEQRLIDLEDEPDQLRGSSRWESSAQLHELRKSSLAAKSPWIVSPLFENDEFDLLIDDSAMTKDLFKKSGLGNRFFRISNHAMSRDRLWTEAAQVVQKLMSAELSQENRSSYPVYQNMFFEDPMYWPLLHIHDQLPDRL